MNNFEFQIQGAEYLAEMACRLPIKTMLDVGFGNGAASMFFRSREKEVIAVDRNISFRGAPVERMRDQGVRVVECDFESLSLEEPVDGIWISHVLEHTLDVGRFLQKARQLLSSDGWLLIMVPPFKHEVVGGHVTPGWNMGILMYVLLVSGFSIKSGHFVKYGYNICGFVQKSKESLPPLFNDQGDIERTADLWPIDVYQGFDGNMSAVNWMEPVEHMPVANSI